MIHLLIAEDEDLVRRGLVDRMRSLELPALSIREASDGAEAMAILAAEPVEILVTDIRMPGVDGLGLAERALEVRPGVRVILVTGYADFGYAQRAIRAGVAAYLLKPISDQEFRDALVPAYQGAVRDQDEKAAAEDSERGHAWGQVLAGAPEPWPLLAAQDRETRWAGCQFMVAVILVPPGLAPRCQVLVAAVPISCLRLVIPGSTEPGEVWVLLGREHGGTLVQVATAYLTTVHSTLSSAGVSGVLGLSGLGQPGPLLVAQGREALGFRFHQPDAPWHRYQSTAPEASLNLPHDRLFRLRTYFERRDLLAIEQTLQELFSPKFLHEKAAVVPRLVWNAVVNTLIEVAAGLGVPSDQLPSGALLNGSALAECLNSSAAVRRLYQASFTALTSGATPELNSASRIRLAVQYLEQHFGTDVTVNDLAERYAMNPSYFSTAFRKETGTTVIGYLTDVRLRKAKEQLTNSDSSIIDISHAVGYQDHQYFFRVFKKATGMTPLEFRRSKAFSGS